MCDHLSIYEEFFGVKEGELLSFSFSESKRENCYLFPFLFSAPNSPPPPRDT